MKTKLTAMILAAGAALGAFGETVDLETLTAAYVAQDGDMLIGTLAGNHKISIAAGATVMLRDVAINGDDSSAMAAVTCEGDAILILGATNSVKGFSGFPGILVPAGKTLTIEGEGSLVARGGGDGAAGIGGSYSSGDCGNISIEGGVITAFGGSGAPGIGCAASSQCGTITITGGLVTSVGRGHACGIGHGYNYNGDSRCSGVVIGPGIIRVVAIGGGSPSYPAIGADSVTVNNNLYDRSEQDVIDGDKRIIELLDAPIDVSVTFVENYTGGGQTEVWMSDTGFVLKKAPEVPVRSGWAFAGWFTAAEGGTQVDEWTRPGYGATYYAHWIKGEFTTFPAYGDKVWVPQKDGSWRTENIDYPKNACLERTVTGPGTLSFEWKAASRFDDMEGAIYLSIDGKNTYTKIQSTDKEWHSLSVPIEDGSHVVKLSFSVGDGSDALGYGATRNWQMTAPDNQWTSGDCTVTLDTETGTLTVSGPGAMEDEYLPPWKEKSDDIKKIVIEDGVTAIGSQAFSDFREATSVQIGKDVVGIGGGAFYDCTSLSGELALPNGLTAIGNYAFCQCQNLSGELLLPNGLITVEMYAFVGCKNFTTVKIPSTVTNIGAGVFAWCTGITDVYCHPNAADLTWGGATSDFKSDGSTKIHVKASQLAAYRAKFGESVRATFVGDLPGDATVTPDVSITAGEYFKATLSELGYDVPTDGQTAYSVKAYGLPAGLKLMSNKAVTKKDKKGKKIVVTPANVEWWIEGVPTATLDYATNPPYLVITTNGVAQTLPLSLGVEAQKVTELDDLMLGDSLNEQFYLPGVTNGWTVSGLPTGLKYTAKLVTTTKKKGKKIISVTTNALPYSVYGKTTKAGLFTITAKKKVGAYYETLKFRVLVNPAPVDTAIFGDELTNIVTMAYVPLNWNLESGEAVPSVPSVPFVPSAVGGKVVKVAGLPAGLAFASATTYKDKKKTQVKQYGQTIVGKPTKPGTYVVTFTKNVTTGTGKKKKTVAKTAQILWVVEPNDVELSLGFNVKGAVIESGTVGLSYGDLMAFSATSNATVTASGLPAGIKLVKLDEGSGRLGEAALPGFATWGFKGFTAKAGTYLVTVTATLNGKTVTQRLALKVEGLPAWAKGTYNGVVYATSGDLDYAGYGTVSVSSAGKISGKFSENGTNWTFSASSYDFYTDKGGYDGDTEIFQCTNVVAKYAYKVTEKDKKGKKKTVTKYLTRNYTLSAGNLEVSPGVMRGTMVVTSNGDDGLVAYQNLWGQSGYTALGKKLFYTSKKVPYKTWASVEADGLGEYDTLSMKVTPAGVATATYKFFKGTFDKKGKPQYATYACTTVLHPQTSAEAGSEGFNAMMHLYFPPVASAGFEKYAEIVRYPFTDRKANVPDKAAIDAAKWCAGEYLGYGYAEFPGEDWLYGIFRVSVGADLAFTGTFEAIDGGVADFSGKLVKNVADGVAITVSGTPMSMGVKAMAKPYGKSKYGEIFAWSEAEEGQPNIHIDRAWQNIWTSVGMASARPKIASGTTKTVDLAGAEIYRYPMGDYVEGDSFTYTFAEDGTVSVTGQVFGVPVDTTTAIAVETESGGTCDCILTFMINGRVFQQNFTMPSGGTVTSESISLDVSSSNFGIING